MAGFAIIIACLGLFGLVSFSVAKRTKEIGVRKVLGASHLQVISLLSKDYVWLIIIAILLAFPITYYSVDQWLLQYSTRIKPDLLLFLVQALVVVTISILTVFIKTFRSSSLDPATSMRDE